MKYLLLVLCFTAGFVGAAQDDSVITSMEDVVVTATRVNAKIVDLPYAITTINRKFLENQMPRSTPESLEGITGVFVQKTNHGGGSAIIRGLTGNQTLILVDGIRLNNATFRYGPNQYLNTVDPFILERIEVVRGTGSVQYGTDALGGVVHIITKEPRFTQKRSFHGKITGKYLSGNMENTVRGDAGFSTDKVSFSSGVSFRDFGDLIGGDTTGKQSPSGYKEWAFDNKFCLQIQPHMRLVVAQQFLRQSHVPVFHKIQLENFAIHEFSEQERMLHYARLHVGGKGKWINEIELTASLQHTGETRQNQKKSNVLLVTEKDKITSAGASVDLASAFLPGWTANSGIELYHDRIRSSRLNSQGGSVKSMRGLYPDRSHYGNYSVYSLHHFRYRKWRFEGGLRYNFFRIRLSDTTVGAVTVQPSALVGNGSVLFGSTIGNFYLAYSTGYRAPNIDDMGTLGVVDFRYETPAYDLRPEQSRNLEWGYKLEQQKWKVSLSMYRMPVINLITRVKLDQLSPAGYPVYQKENTGRALIRGLESSIGVDLNRYIHLFGTVVYTHGQNLSRSEPLRRIPPLYGSNSISFRKGPWFGKFAFLFAARQNRLAQGDKEDNRIPAGGTPGWETFNLYAGYDAQAVRINAGLQNIANEDYRTHGSGINAMGRSVWIACTLKL